MLTLLDISYKSIHAKFEEVSLGSGLTNTKYIKSTIDHGFLYKNGESYNLTSYCDIDYARDNDIRRSTIGYVFKIESGVVS